MKDTADVAEELAHAIIDVISKYDDKIDKPQLIGIIDITKQAFITAWEEEGRKNLV